MNSIAFIYFLPLLASIILSVQIKFSEKFITRLSTFSQLVPSLTTIILLVYGAFKEKLPLEINLLRLSIEGHSFDFIIWIDQGTLLMLTLTHLLGMLVIKFSYGYLHLEKGFQRFFGYILFFIFGMYIISAAGTLDLFFAGWEIVGISSFFLIGFYRSHNRSLQNATRIYNIYRVCDIGLLMGAVMGHVLWHEATRFSEITNFKMSMFSQISPLTMFIMGFFLVFASIGKSGQFPFQNWPAKAMEGPTPSSAIFYGALSIHAGVFLLIRTYNLWVHSPYVWLIVMGIGTLTFIFSTLQGRVQSNIKGQIAYASTAQIGLMYVELSLGLTSLCLWHLFLHAIYRCFQLLVSPSIVFHAGSLNNKVTFDRISKGKKWEITFLPQKINKTLYTLALNDFSMDPSWRGFGFIPWRKAYLLLKSVLEHPYLLAISCIVLIGVLSTKHLSLPYALSCASLFLSISALIIQQYPHKSLRDLALSLFFDGLSIYVMDPHATVGLKIFSLSIIPAIVIALTIGYKFKNLQLSTFHAQGARHPLLANTFMLCFLIMAGMPISSAFFGEDIILEELINHSHFMAFSTTMSLMLNGIICVRIYTKIFMGTPTLNGE